MSLSNSDYWDLQKALRRIYDKGVNEQAKELLSDLKLQYMAKYGSDSQAMADIKAYFNNNSHWTWDDI